MFIGVTVSSIVIMQDVQFSQTLLKSRSGTWNEPELSVRHNAIFRTT